MLARASSDAGARLRRSKSTSVVHRRAPPIAEPLDAEVAQKHAIAAATVAFARFHAKEPIEPRANRSTELTRSKSTTNRKSLTSQGSHFPPRGSSTRSVPPQDNTRTISINPHSLALAADPDNPPFNPTPGSDRLSSAVRPLSAKPSTSFVEHGRPTSQAKSHRQSAASSITSQQIRKARSMYYASSVQTGSPVARPPAKYLTTPPNISANPALISAPTTYVPSRSTVPSPLAAPHVSTPVVLDDTINKARDEHLLGFQQRSVKNKPSMFLAPFKNRQDKAKEKTKLVSSSVTPVPDTSILASADPVVDITMNNFMPQLDVKERRSLSGSLRRKIKKVFRRTSTKSPKLPVQQIEASRDYFGIIESNPLCVDDRVTVPRPDDALLQRVRSRAPSLENRFPQLPRFTSRRSSSSGSARSDRSLHSEASISQLSPSRVTSWGTSTSGETLTQRAIKRLTVIHEAKDSISSVTDRATLASSKRKSLPVPALSAFRNPMHMENLTEEASTSPVDPKRVFSALMREIDASRSTEASTYPSDRTPGAESDVFESSKTKELHSSARELHSSASRDSIVATDSRQKFRPGSAAARSIQSKKSSIRSFGRAIRSTIRTVTPTEHKLSPCLDQSSSLHSEPGNSSSGVSSSPVSDGEGYATTFKGRRIQKKKSGHAVQYQLGESRAPTSEQVEVRTARAKNRWQMPLERSTTPYFPRETNRLFTITNIAQKLSLEPVHGGFGSTNPMPSTMQPSRSVQTPMSPSVYSRNTDGASILPNDSVLSFTSPYESERVQNAGSAVILNSQSVRSYVIGTPSPKRPSSARSSRDWKAWLSHEVSGIETISQEELTIHEQYITPGRPRSDMPHPIRTSHTGSEDTTVIARGSFEIPTPTPQIQVESHITGSPDVVQQADRVSGPEQPTEVKSTITVLVNTARHPDIRKKGTVAHGLPEGPQENSATSVMTPLKDGDHSLSTIHHTFSASQPTLGTPNSARMNDRFPFLNTGKRSSSSKSSFSGASKSPTSSVGSSSKSLKTTPNPKVIYSDISAPGTASSAHCVLSTAVRGYNVPQKSKENVSPPSMGGGHKRLLISPLGLALRPNSLQPLSSVATKTNSINVVQGTTDAVDTIWSKRGSSPAELPVARPCLRAIMRPISPEKLSRRPRSAFDLRNTPPPRPASELRRPGLQPRLSPQHTAHGIEPKVVDAEECGVSGSDIRAGSATPGQKMAERFLKERKSTAVLERGVRRSTSKFIREDTPAFL